MMEITAFSHVRNPVDEIAFLWNGSNVKIEIPLEGWVLILAQCCSAWALLWPLDFARMGRLQLDRGVLAHFFRLPSVGKRRHRLFNVAFWRRHIVPLILIERAAQTLMKPLKKRERSYHQSKPFSV